MSSQKTCMGCSKVYFFFANEKPTVDISSIPKQFRTYHKRSVKFHQEILTYQLSVQSNIEQLEKEIRKLREIMSVIDFANRKLAISFQANTDLDSMFEEINTITDAVQEMFLMEGMNYFSELIKM